MFPPCGNSEHCCRNPAPGDSWLEYFTWLVGCGRWALEAIAQVVGAPLDTADRPGEHQSSSSYWDASYANLLSVLDEWPAGGSGSYGADSARAPEHDAELVRYFHRWTQRQQFLIDGTGARHEGLIRSSPQPLTGWD
jgi:hypothetical protein